MAIWSEINIADLQYTRIDSDYYSPKYLTEEHTWSNLRFQYEVSNLRSLIAEPVRTGRTPANRTVKEGEMCVHFVKTNTLRKGRIDYASCDFLPKRILRTTDYIEDNSVVVTIIGATPKIVGRAAIIRAQDPLRVTNQNVAIVKTNAKLNPYFFTAYLQTEYGRDQLWRQSRRTEQVNLNCREVERILVPLFTPEIQESIGCLVEESFICLDNSKALYSCAQELLEKELGLDKLVFDKPAGYTARFSIVGLSDSVEAARIDAQCFSPEAVFYENWLLKNTNSVNLNTLLSSVEKGHQQIEVERGRTDYCSIKHISGREIIGASKTVAASGTACATNNDLLLAVTGATIGKIGIVRRYNNLLFSGDMLRLRANEQVDPHYLLLLLDHHIGQVQFNRWITGSTNGHLSPNDVKRILVPRLSPVSESKIAKLVADSMEKRQESEQLLAQAKARVEQLIEEAVEK